MRQVGFDEGLSARLAEHVNRINAALAMRWWQPRLPADLEQDFTTASDAADRAAFRLWFACIVGLHAFGLTRDALFGALPTGILLRVLVAMPLALATIWLLRRPMASDRREALTSLAFFGSFNAFVVLALSMPQPAADRYLMAAAFGFCIVHLGMPFTVRQTLVHVATCVPAILAIALLHRFGADGTPDHLALMLPVVATVAAGGGIFLRDARRRAYLMEQRARLQAEALEAANRSLGLLLRQDTLTGVQNRRFFDETLAETWLRMRALGQPLAVILLDVDRFKSFNDHRGHLAGDAALREVARCLDASVRDSDSVVARFGGEEFAVILPGVSCSAAQAVGLRLREAVEALRLPHPDGSTVTVSVGVSACVPDAERDCSALVQAADAALYASKTAGRNCVTANVISSAPAKVFAESRGAAA